MPLPIDFDDARSPKQLILGNLNDAFPLQMPNALKGLGFSHIDPG
jgi:hypothetical protein